jgi:SsrA-binding protein
LHKGEIERLIGRTSEKGLTLIPTRLYWKNGRAKIEIALARGKNVQDKRRYLKDKDAHREIQQALQDR